MGLTGVVVLGVALAMAGEGKELPAELAPFVSPRHEALDFAVGDLDGDGRADAVLVLKGPDEVQKKDDMEARRPLLLLIRQPDGRLKLERRSDRLVYCRTCGGVAGDPYHGIAVGEGRFTVSHLGSRWENAYTFAYDRAERDWFLDREQTSSAFADRDPVRTEESTLTRQELGDFPLETFDPTSRSRRTTWRVTATQAYFYDRPDLKSRPRRAYVVKGDVIEGWTELRTFIWAQFANSDRGTTSGYLRKADLEREAAEAIH